MARVFQNERPGFWRLFFAFRGWIIVIVTVAVAGISVGSIHTYWLADQFDRYGQWTSAEITDHYTRTKRDSEGRRTTEYVIEVFYDHPAQGRVDLTHKVGRDQHGRLAVGQEIELRYLPQRPQRTELKEGETHKAAVVLQILGLVIGLVWLGLIWWIGGTTVRAIKTRRDGQLVAAEVTEVVQTNVRVNKVHQYRLKWRTSDGHTGQSRMRPEADFGALRKGDEIQVYALKGSSWWTGDVGKRPEHWG